MEHDNLIKNYLTSFSQKFPVEWDRYCESGNHYDVYGWIRRRDGQRDFVLLHFDITALPGRKLDVNFVTSSAKYSEEIYKFIFDGETEGHNSCIRIADMPGILLPPVPEVNEDSPRCEHELTVEDYFGRKIPFIEKEVESGTLVDLVCAAREGYIQMSDAVNVIGMADNDFAASEAILFIEFVNREKYIYDPQLNKFMAVWDNYSLHTHEQLYEIFKKIK